MGDLWGDKLEPSLLWVRTCNPDCVHRLTFVFRLNDVAALAHAGDPRII